MKAPNSRNRNSVSVSLGHHKKKKNLLKLLVMVRSIITLHSTLGVLLGSIYSCTFAGIVGIEMVDDHWPVKQLFFVFRGKKSPKRRHCPNFRQKNPLFFLKINSPDCAPFKVLKRFWVFK